MSRLLKSRWAKFGTAVALLGLLLTLCWGFGPWGGINRVSYWRVRLGMTKEEITAVIGLPPGTYRTREPAGGITAAGNWGVTVAEAGISEDELSELKAEQTADGRSRASEERWWGTYSAIVVAFDEDGRVIRKCFIDIPW